MLYMKLKYNKKQKYKPTSVFPTTILADGYSCLRVSSCVKFVGLNQVTFLPFNTKYCSLR